MALLRTFINKWSSAGFNTPRVRAVLLLCIIVYVVFIVTLSYAWYASQKAQTFNFFNDLGEWKQLDKFAHFFWTFQACALIARLLNWAQLQEKASRITATLMGFIFVTSIEVGDGFSVNYGASIYDAMANALGAAAFFGQHLFWKSIKIWPKFSFHATTFAPLRPDLLGNGLLTEVLKDYNGQTFWYSAHFKFLPLPRWLTLAVGVGAEGMVYGRDEENALMNFSPYRKYFLSFDLNLSHVQTSSKIVNALLYVLNIIKFPAPALEFSSQGIKFHPLYF